MSSIFGGKSTQKQTTVTTPFSGQYATWADQVGSELMSKFGKTGQAYTGQLTANTNNNLSNVFSLANQYTNNQVLNDFASGKYLDPTTNPYAQAGYDAGTKSMMKQFGQIDDTIKGSFNSNGLYNSSMRQNSQQKNAETTKDAISSFGSKYWGDLYNQGISNMMQANTAQQQNLGTALYTGTTQQSLEQKGLDNQYKEFLRQQGVSDQSIANILNYLNIVKNPSQETTTQTKQHGLFK